MPVVSCKCPNCDGGLIFSPEKQAFICEYCQSSFTREQVEKLGDVTSAPSAADSSAQPPDAPPEPAASPTDDGFAASVYSCPSCGAEVFTDETTAASICYYCHNPILLSGRLDGALRPDCVIPFAIEKKEIEQKFLDWCKHKWFIRHDFYSSVQLDKLTGVYFPFWLTDTTCDCRINAKGNRIRVWRAGDIEYTETSVYQIIRHADVSFDDLTLAAIDRADVQLANGVYPYDFSQMTDFSMAYLTGFQAEKRSLEAAQLHGQLESTICGHAETILRDSISGYTGVSVEQRAAAMTADRWRYVLLPVWALTCSYGGQIYYYAVNGQTGKVCGRVPVSPLRLAILAAGVAVACFTALTLLWGWIG